MMLPATPPAFASPVAIVIDPDEPLLVVPVANDSRPLTPSVPASGVFRTIAPEVVAVLAPVIILMAPPTSSVAEPPAKATAPPTPPEPVAAPPVIEIRPPTPLA